MTFSKEKNKDFITLYSKSKRHIPGPDTYQVDFAKIYKPMRKRWTTDGVMVATIYFRILKHWNKSIKFIKLS